MSQPFPAPWPPVQPPYPVQPLYPTLAPPRPTSVTVLAIIGIILASLGLLANIACIFPYITTGHTDDLAVTAVRNSAVLLLWTLLTHFAGMGLSVLLLSASIASLKLRPWARNGMLIYARCAIGLVIFNTLVFFFGLWPGISTNLPAAARTAEFVVPIWLRSLLVSLLALIYPICILKFFRNPRVIDAFEFAQPVAPATPSAASLQPPAIDPFNRPQLATPAGHSTASPQPRAIDPFAHAKPATPTNPSPDSAQPDAIDPSEYFQPAAPVDVIDPIQYLQPDARASQPAPPRPPQPVHPIAQPGPPRPMHPFPYPPPQFVLPFAYPPPRHPRPACVTVLAIIGIIFSACGMLDALGHLLLFVLTPSAFRHIQYTSGLSVWPLANGVIEICLTIVLLAASIGSLTLRPWARLAMFIFAIADIVWMAVYAPFFVFWFAPNALHLRPLTTGLQLPLILLLFVIGTIYPTLVLLYYRTPRVTQAFHPPPDPTA